jgi:hypothetical protein
MPLDSILAGDAAVNPDRYVRLSFWAPSVAHLRITKWDRVGPAVDRAFAKIDSTGARYLILDIRGNPGGDATSAVPLAHLFRDTIAVGVFVGRKWYESHPRPPGPAEFARMPTLPNDAAPARLLLDLRDHGAVVGRAIPRAPYFGGAVFLVIDGATASASEPLAHMLGVTRRATIIGERTAGHMLTALPHPLRDGWVATIPVADFIAADGTRIEGSGVQPDVKVPADRVFLAIADQLSTAAPFAASVLRAGSLEGLQRPADAEREYRAALRVADRESSAPAATWLAIIHKRLAAILTARGDRAGAQREYQEVLRLTPDDADAQASAQDRFSGNWRGYWTQAGDTMAVTMRMQREPGSGRYSATFDAERLRVSGIPFDTVRIEGAATRMTLRGDCTMAFTGTLRADSGWCLRGPGEGRFVLLRRVAAAHTTNSRLICEWSVNLAGSLILHNRRLASSGRSSSRVWRPRRWAS